MSAPYVHAGAELAGLKEAVVKVRESLQAFVANIDPSMDPMLKVSLELPNHCSISLKIIATHADCSLSLKHYEIWESC